MGCLLPAFLGESHFAFLSYAKNFRPNASQKELDYLRQLGGSKEAAKELKLFGLSQFSDGPLYQHLEPDTGREPGFVAAALIAVSLLSR